MAKFDLVFEGGGAKGMVFVGALQAFEEAGHTHDRVLGTSAGAITATLLAAGYDSQEISRALDQGSNESGGSVFAEFLGEPRACGPQQAGDSATQQLLEQLERAYLPKWLHGKLAARFSEKLLSSERNLPRRVCSLLERGGVYSADRFRLWMRQKLDESSPEGEPRNFGQHTLSQFHEATGTELCLVASDTTAGKMLVLNHRTAPECPVVRAVQMSMSIPLLWQEVKWDPEWGEYQGEDITDHVVVDGGILSNFPIELLVSDLPEITETMGAGRAENFLGLLIDETLEVRGSGPQGGQPATAATEQENPWQDLRSVDRLARLIDTMTSMRTNQLVDAFESFVVRLPARGYTTTEFQMSPERREALRSAGHEAMRDYLETNQRLVDAGRGSDEYSRAAEHANRMAKRLIDQGRQARKRLDFEEAVDFFRKALEADSSSQEALLLLVSDLFRLVTRDSKERDHAQARLRLQEVRDVLDGTNSIKTEDTLLLRGYLEASVARIEADPLAKQASAEAAARIFTKVVELRPRAAPRDLSSAHWGLGNVHFLREQYEDAVACYNEAFSYGSGSGDRYYLLAEAYRGIRDRLPNREPMCKQTRELMRKELKALTQALESNERNPTLDKRSVSRVEEKISWLKSRLDSER